jgi:hypothetical protein
MTNVPEVTGQEKTSRFDAPDQKGAVRRSDRFKPPVQTSFISRLKQRFTTPDSPKSLVDKAGALQQKYTHEQQSRAEVERQRLLDRVGRLSLSQGEQNQLKSEIVLNADWPTLEQRGYDERALGNQIMPFNLQDEEGYRLARQKVIDAFTIGNITKGQQIRRLRSLAQLRRSGIEDAAALDQAAVRRREEEVQSLRTAAESTVREWPGKWHGQARETVRGNTNLDFLRLLQSMQDREFYVEERQADGSYTNLPWGRESFDSEQKRIYDLHAQGVLNDSERNVLLDLLDSQQRVRHVKPYTRGGD